jgi:hypothetical protein
MPLTEPDPFGTCLAYAAQPGPTRSAAGSAAALLLGAAALLDGAADLLLESLLPLDEPPPPQAAVIVRADTIAAAAAILLVVRMGAFLTVDVRLIRLGFDLGAAPCLLCGWFAASSYRDWSIGQLFRIRCR